MLMSREYATRLWFVFLVSVYCCYLWKWLSPCLANYHAQRQWNIVISRNMENYGNIDSLRIFFWLGIRCWCLSFQCHNNVQILLIFQTFSLFFDNSENWILNQLSCYLWFFFVFFFHLFCFHISNLFIFCATLSLFFSLFPSRVHFFCFSIIFDFFWIQQYHFIDP